MSSVVQVFVYAPKQWIESNCARFNCNPSDGCYKKQKTTTASLWYNRRSGEGTNYVNRIHHLRAKSNMFTIWQVISVRIFNQAYLKMIYIPHLNCSIVVWGGYYRPIWAVLCVSQAVAWHTLSQPDWLTVQHWLGSCTNTPRLAKTAVSWLQQPCRGISITQWGNTDPRAHLHWNQYRANSREGHTRQQQMYQRYRCVNEIFLGIYVP